MAKTTDQIRFIIYDFKYSWYFRVWAVFWFLGLVFSFTALILLSQRSGEAGSERDFKVHINNASELTFPRIQFSISYHNPAISIATKTCYHSGTPIITTTCESVNGVTPGLDKCFAVESDSITIYNNGRHNFNTSHIYCHINTTATHVGNNSMLVWRTERGRGIVSDLFLRHNSQIWVVLRPVNFAIGGTHHQDWERELVYHSSVAHPGQFSVRTVIATFIETDVRRVDIYDGYRAIGDIGGFMYFMVILHTLLLIIAGAFLSNTSKFLGGEVSRQI